MGNRFTGATVRMCSTSVNRKLNLENSTCFLRHGLTNTPEADRIAAVRFGGMLAQAPFFMASSLIQSAS